MFIFTWLKEQIGDLYNGLSQTDGKFSSTKFFSSVAYATITWVVVHQELKGTLTTEMVLVYGGLVAGHNVLLRKYVKTDAQDGK